MRRQGNSRRFKVDFDRADMFYVVTTLSAEVRTSARVVWQYYKDRRIDYYTMITDSDNNYVMMAYEKRV